MEKEGDSQASMPWMSVMPEKAPTKALVAAPWYTIRSGVLLIFSSDKFSDDLRCFAVIPPSTSSPVRMASTTFARV